MSDQKTIVGTVLTAIDGLGYVLSNDNFDFEGVPSSIQDKAYRYEIITNNILELSGNRIEKNKTLDLWVVYRLTAGGDRRAAVLTMLGNVEAIEDQLMKTLLSLPSLVMKTNMSKYVNDYVVFNIGFDFTYWRDL